MKSDELILAVQSVSSKVTMPDFTVRSNLVAHLVFIYQMMIASEQLLESAIEESHGKLKDYFVAHLAEERNHAQWLREDILSAGVDVSTIKRIAAAVELAGSQYYLIKHVSPLCLLGYMATLEGFPVSLEYIEKLEELHGTKLLRTCRHHAEEDLWHRIDLFDIIDQIGDELILENAVDTALKINTYMKVVNNG